MLDTQSLSIEEKLELIELLETRSLRARQNKLASYAPYKKQRDFHGAGNARERLFMAGNQLGKTWAGAYEVAIHATGRYPDWWDSVGGRRFPRATRWIVGSESAELTKKGIQRLLLGEPEKRDEWGTGTIPHDCIISTSPRSGVPDAVSSIVVKHALGDQSVIQLNSYDQGRTKWQADTVDGVWFDEEPDLALYSEGLTRTQATGGLVFVTFTPLLGMSAVVKRFLLEKQGVTISMTIEDAEHYTPEQRAAIIAGYPAHERDARARGIPIMGSGLVFPVIEAAVKCDPFPLPPHFARINAWDFGWGHPAAWVSLAHDRDTDIAYVTDLWRGSEKPVMEQAGIVLAKGQADVPHAWPHDGLQHDKGSGEQLAEQYKKYNIHMLPNRATFEDGSHGLEAGISMMLERMQSRRLRVFSHLNEWFDEMRMYHRKDGVIVKLDDDILSATRYGLMMLREAKTLHEIPRLAAQRRNQHHILLPQAFVMDPVAGY
jgi:phage terminase large subunit-like protein